MAAHTMSLLSQFTTAQRKILEVAAEILGLQLEELIILKHRFSTSKFPPPSQAEEKASFYDQGDQQHGLSRSPLGPSPVLSNFSGDLQIQAIDDVPLELPHRAFVGAATESLNKYTIVPLTGGWLVPRDESTDPDEVLSDKSNIHTAQGSSTHIEPSLNQVLRSLQRWKDLPQDPWPTSEFNPCDLDPAFTGLPQAASTAVGIGHDSGHFGHNCGPRNERINRLGNATRRYRQLTQWADSDTPQESIDSQQEDPVPTWPRNRKRKRSVSTEPRRDVDLTTSHPHPHPRRSVESPQESGVAHRTTKAVSCLRCRMQHIKCIDDPLDPRGICKTCSNITGQTIVKLPCLRYKIADVKLLDKGPHPRLIWTRRFPSMKIVEIDTWFSSEVKTITLTQDVFDTSYDINVRQFIPQQGDALERTWQTDGEAHSVACAPYAIADMHKTAKTVSQFVDNSISSYINYHIDETDHFLKRTYTMAYRHYQITQNAEQKALLNAVLRFWTASRMESKQERICSEETLQMSPQIHDNQAENFDKICLPPVMQAQVEIITTSAILLPMQKEIIKHLSDLVKAKDRPVRWFTLYLSMFVLLHSCALLTRAQHKRARRHNPVGSSIRYYNPSVVEEIHWGARIMLAHFHYANNGCQPFKMDWSQSQTSTFAQLDKEQVAFVRETIERIEQKRERFERILREGEFEDEYYFLAQMYESEWRPRHTV